MFIVGERAGSFNEWSNDTSEGAQCDLLEAEYKNSCNCETEDGDDGLVDDAEDIPGCTWPDEGYGPDGGQGLSCDLYCD